MYLNDINNIFKNAGVTLLEDQYEGDNIVLDEKYVQRNTRDEKYGIEYNTDYIEFEPEMKLVDENDKEWEVIEVKGDKVLLMSDNNEFQVMTQEELNTEIDIEKWKCIFDDRFFTKDDYKRATGQDYPKDILTEDEEDDDEESYNPYDDLDDTQKEIVDTINIMEENKSNMKVLEKTSEELYDICRNYDRSYEEAAYDFERELFDSAMEDDDNRKYSTPRPENVDLDKVMDDFYSELYNNITSIIDRYYWRSVGYIFDEIQNRCEEFFEEEQTEYVAEPEPEVNPMDIDDQTTIDESYDPNLSSNETVKEIYDFVTTEDPQRVTDSELCDLFKKCRDCGCSNLESYIEEIEDEMRDSYVNDKDNWGTEYDYDATYEYVSDMSMSTKIQYYATNDNIINFMDTIKKFIEDDTNYIFSEKEEEKIYDGDDTELDESVEDKWDYVVGDKVRRKGGKRIYTIKRIDNLGVTIEDKINGYQVCAEIVNKKPFEELFEPVGRFSTADRNYDGDDTELDESAENSLFNKLLKLHKENPKMDIRDIAKNITDGNIEEYISLMKQYFEKFEK